MLPENARTTLGLCVLLLSPILISGQAPAKPPDDSYISKDLEAHLLDIAREAITTSLQILVSGDLEGNLKNKKFARLYREAMMEKFKLQVFTRDKLRETRQDYKDFKTKLKVKAASRKGNRITLRVTESTELKFDVPGGPPFYGYVDDHLFEFVYVGGEWVLVKDTIPRPEPSPVNTAEKLPTGKLHMIPLKAAPPGYSPGKARGGRPGDPGDYLVKAFFAPYTMPTGLDHSAAANYATT